jgi:hypothetical protein
MNTKPLTKFIFIEEAQNNMYYINYPSIIFPNKCIGCGKPRETAEELDLFTTKTVDWSRTISQDRLKTVGINMKFAVPLCADHKKYMEDHKARMKQEQKSLFISIGLSALLGMLVFCAIFFGFFDNSKNVGGTIFLSVLFGAPLGVLVFWPLWYTSWALIRLIQKKKPYFYKDPFIAPYTFEFMKDENYVSMRLMIGIENEQIWNEFKTINQIEEHLIAAIKHKDETVSVNAISALGQTGGHKALSAIINIFIENIHQSHNICNAATKALKSLGLPQPLNAEIVEQLLAGLKYECKNVITLLSLSSIEHLLAALDNPDAGVCTSVIYELGETRNPAAVPALIQLLGDRRSSWGTRVGNYAVRTLKRIGTPEALDAVEKWKVRP